MEEESGQNADEEDAVNGGWFYCIDNGLITSGFPIFYKI